MFQSSADICLMVGDDKNRKEAIKIAALERGARGKDLRRTKLIQTARELIMENVNGEFSMRELAVRAGLSLATPYNLFGSKTAILQGVFIEQGEQLQNSLIALQSKTPKDMVMNTAENIVSVVVNNAKFYRSLAKTMGAVDPYDVRSSFTPNVQEIFRPLVDRLIEDEAIVTKVSPSLISTNLMAIFTANFLFWASYEWEKKFFCQQIKVGFAFCLVGMFDGENQEALLSFLQKSKPVRAKYIEPKLSPSPQNLVSQLARQVRKTGSK